MNRRETVERAAAQWAKELTDESGRNRLLYYKELKAGTLSLDDAHTTALRHLLNGKKVQAQALFREELYDDALRRIRAVKRKATINYEERGINTLFLGWGMATWKPVLSKAKPAAPVLLCPVDLERTGAAEVDFDMRLSGDWTLNEALLQHLAKEFDVDVSGEDLMDPYGDGEQISKEEEKAIFAALSTRAERVPDFGIAERVVMGNFMFKKMPMVNDINENLESMARHDLIAAIAGAEEAKASLKASQARSMSPSLPDRTPPENEFLVLDADSSQNAAINAALAGESFVLQGPPGTGKSQTISNLIAAMMAEGKSVLFVAEKRAAIEAVAKRLAKVGLDGFVMDLHGGVSSRKELAQQLGESLNRISQTPPVDQHDLHRQLKESRQELSGYAKALHQERKPWGLSYFEVLSRLLPLEAVESPTSARPQPPIQLPPSALAELNESIAHQVRRNLEKWAELSEPLRSGRSPWANAQITTDTEAAAAFDGCMGLAGQLTSNWHDQQSLLAGDLGISHAGSIESWGEVVSEVQSLSLAVAHTQAVLSTAVFDQDLDTLLEDLAPATGTKIEALSDPLELHKPRSAAECSRLIAEIPDLTRTTQHTISVLSTGVFHLDLDTLLEDLAPATGSTISRTHNRLFNKRYRSALADLENLKPGLGKLHPRTLHQELDAARTLTTRWTELGCTGTPEALANTNADEIAQIAQRYEASLAELENLKPGISELHPRTLHQELDAARTLTTRWTELGCTGTPRITDNADGASQAFEELKRAIEKLSLLPAEGRVENETAEYVSVLAQELLSDEDTLFRLPRLAEVDKSLRDAHVGPLLDKASSNTLPGAELVTAFDHSWLRSIQREVRQSDSRLSGFSGISQSRYLEEFQKADTAHLKGAPARVARRIAEHAVAALDANGGQHQLIRREAQKKTRHRPLRRLFEEAPEVLSALRPCWAMSPLDVAQTLPPRPLFDIVVFDEASQVLPCDAISALLRGKRAMVAGDSRQLPPTIFFDSSNGDDDIDEDEEAMSDYESILDVMGTRLSQRPLTWHYRSQDERLIAYSNQQIYRGSLTTFPGAATGQCLNWEYVPHRAGVAAEKGSNPDEVQRVVELMLDHAQQRPAESLGVIAMGINHANRIEEELFMRVRQENSPELEEFFRESREERVFVKNLERVQGDERDAIILSIGYGKNADGKMQYRFGPLNHEGGERRLNVAITRARQRMTLVSSFGYDEMDPERTRSTGAKMLRGFLKFAESGGSELSSADERDPLIRFEMDVVEKLTAAGLEVIPQYGVSGYRIDFAVRHPSKPGQFALAVEADGDGYRSLPTARDRDRLRQEHLERLGWRFYRIWSTEWFNDHRREVERVLAAYEKAVESIDAGMDNRPIATDQSEALPGDLGTTTPPQPADPAISRGLNPFKYSYVVSSIDDISHHELVALVRWINSDGLLRTNEQLFEEVFAELPFNRRGAKINAAINKAIRSATDSSESRATSRAEPVQGRQQTPDAATSTSTEATTSNWIRYDYNIVGERHYTGALNNLMRGAPSEKDERKRREVCLQLVAQPYNQYDRNAISIQWEGKILGHIARNQTMDIHRTYGDRLLNGVEVDGLVTGRKGKWSVRLDLKSIR